MPRGFGGRLLKEIVRSIQELQERVEVRRYHFCGVPIHSDVWRDNDRRWIGSAVERERFASAVRSEYKQSGGGFGEIMNNAYV